MISVTAPSSPARLLEATVDTVVADMGYELLLLEWLGSSKRRVLRLYIDSPKGVTVEDCSRMSRIVGNALDAAEVAAKAGEGDPALAALLDRPYTLEVSSPGVDRPLVRRRHFEQHVGGKLRLETLEAIEGADDNEQRFAGRLVAVQDDEAHPRDPDFAEIIVADDRKRTLRIPLTRIRRANLVWEG